MAITNVEAVRFCNDRVRLAADRLARAYYTAKFVMAEWYANSMGDLIQTGGGTVEDGAATDGRHVITADEVLNLLTRCNELIADMEASSNAKLNTVLAVAMNPAWY